MKRRPPTVSTGNAGVTAVRAYCDRHGLIFQAEPREDFGIDCYVEAEIAPYPQNFLVGLQVKSGPSHRYDRRDGTFSVSVQPDDAQYWLAANFPVLLVYLHEKGPTLYFRHVQAAFADAQSLSQCTSLVFGEADRAADGRMAEYVRELARATPSILNRFRVLSGLPVITAGAQRIALKPAASAAETLCFDRFRASGTHQLWRLFDIYDRVLGYSADERWVCEVRVPDGWREATFSVEIAFVDLVAHASVQVPLVTTHEDALGSMTPVDWPAYHAKIDRLNALAELLDIQPVRVLHDAYDLPTTTAPQVRLSFGGEEFVLGVGPHEGRDALTLSATGYQPPRAAHLLIQHAPFAFVLPSGHIPRTMDELRPMEKPLRFEYVAGVTCSQRGGRLTVAVMSEETHPEWGVRAVYLVHLGVEEMRRACADALRT